MPLLTQISRWRKRIKFCSLNAAEIDRLCLPDTERASDEGGNLPLSLRRWLLSLDLSRAKVVEMVTPNCNSHSWFMDLVGARTVKSYTCFSVSDPSSRGTELGWKIVTEKAAHDPYDIVLLNDPYLDDYKKAEAACNSHGVIILCAQRNTDVIVDYARNKGCGAIQYVSDMRDITGSYEVSTVLFRHSAIFR